MNRIKQLLESTKLLNSKIGIKEDDKFVQKLAEKTIGFSFAQLRELLVSTRCLGKDVDKTITRIRDNIEECVDRSKSLINRMNIIA